MSLLAKTTVFLCFLSVALLSVTTDLLSKEKKDKQEDKKVPVRSSTVFGIYPPIIDLQCPPGQRVTAQIKIENPNALPAAFALEPVGPIPFHSNTLVNKPIATLPPDHLSRHIQFEAKEIILPGKSYRHVNIFIDVPATLKGTHYTGLTTTNVSPGLENPGLSRPEEYRVELGVGMQPGIATTIKCHIVGTLQPSFLLKKIVAHPRKGNQPMSLSAVIQNTGNSEVYLLTSLILLDNKGKVSARMKSERGITIIPGATAEIPFQPVFKDIPKGSYKAILTSADPKLNLPIIEHHVTIQ